MENCISDEVRIKLGKEKLELNEDLFTSFRPPYPGVLTPKTKRMLTLPAEERSGSSFSDCLCELEGMIFFHKFTNQTKEILAKKLVFVTHEADEYLLRQGEVDNPPQAMYVIVSGVVSLQYKVSEVNRNWPEMVLRKGECFGDTDLLHRRPSVVDAYTVGYCELLMLKREDFFIVESVIEEQNSRLIQHLQSTEVLAKFNWTDDEYKVLEVYCKLCIFHQNREIYRGEEEKPFWSFFVVAGECKVVRKICYYIRESASGQKKLTAVENARGTLAEDIHIQKKLLEFRGAKRGYFFGVGENFGINRIMATSATECLVVPRLLLIFKNRSLLRKMANDLTVSFPSDQEILDNYADKLFTTEQNIKLFKEIFKDKPWMLAGSEKETEKPRFINYV